MSGIAVIGASETGVWTLWLLRNLKAYGYCGPIWLINPGRDAVFGHKCLSSLGDVDEAIELGVIITSPSRAVSACTELISRNTPEILLVSNGFKETGTAEGAALEAKLAAMCSKNGVRLVGPNCVGFARFHDRLCAIAEPVPQDVQAGDVSLISNSGALLSGLLHGLSQDGVGIDVCYSIGNGAAFDLAAAVEQAGTRDTTRIICALVEAIPGKERLAGAIRRGRERGCEFVFLLLGQSESAKAIAASHTGAVLGEGRLARAWLCSEGVTVVNSISELSHTAALLSKVGHPGPEKGVMIVSGSGGACGLAADTLVRHGVPFAQLSQDTIEKVRKLLPTGAFVGNPLDIVSGTPEERGAICKAVAADPAVGVLLEPFAVVWPDHSDERLRHRETMSYIASAAASAGIPYVLSSTYPGPLTDFMKEMRARQGIAVQAGIEVTAQALRNIYEGQRPPVSGKEPRESGTAAQSRVIGEAEGRRIIGRWGLNVVPGAHAATTDDVIAAAGAMLGPWVVKIGNAGIAHKGRIGGVKVGLCNMEELRAACSDIAHGAIQHGVIKSAEEATYLIQQMVTGPELLVATIRDPIVGGSVTVGIGGWAAETGHIFFTIPLPAQADAFESKVRESTLPKLLNQDQRNALVRLLVKLGDAFDGAAMANYDVVECNPVMLTAQGALVADVLILPSQETPAGTQAGESRAA